jgi:alkylation response protein AidB-like acyl-CoA dehydrogenase
MPAASVLPKVKNARGGSFLIEEIQPYEVFTPEDFTEEQLYIAKTAAEFANKEILPAAEDIEAKRFDITKGLLRKAGSLGLLAVDIPEQYGGLEMDKVTSALIAESLSKNASFSVAFGAHSGIGTLPLVWNRAAEDEVSSETRHR